jgi:hypothetical protein
MQGPVSSPICHDHAVCLIPIPGADKQLQVYPPIWHPLVWWPSSRIDKENVSGFLHDTRFPSPVNVDAAVQWHRDRQQLLVYNAEIRTLLEQGGECCICLEEHTMMQFTCHNKHWCCIACSVGLVSCPTCRFVPMKHRKNPLVAYN